MKPTTLKMIVIFAALIIVSAVIAAEMHLSTFGLTLQLISGGK